MTDKKHHSLVKTVIILYEDQGFTIEEIAHQLGKSKKQIEKIVNDNCNVYED